MFNYNLRNNILIKDSRTGVRFNNEDAVGPVNIWLPPPYEGKTFGVLQLSDFPIFVWTNHREVAFLWKGKHPHIKLPGGIDHIGTQIILRTLQSRYWTVEASLTTTESLLTEV